MLGLELAGYRWMLLNAEDVRSQAMGSAAVYQTLLAELSARRFRVCFEQVWNVTLVHVKSKMWA